MTRSVAAQGFLAAVKSSDVATMRRALDADPSLRDRPGPDGLSPLLVAIYHRRRDAVDLLVARGALRTVHEAAALGDEAAVERMVRAEPRLLETPGVDGAFPLHLAAHFRHAALIDRLVALGADVDALCGPFFSNRPLHAAAAGRAVASVRALLGHGAPVDGRDAGGHTPLHVAAAGGATEIVALLLEAGADPAAANKDGKTPRDLAAARAMDDVLALLPSDG